MKKDYIKESIKKVYVSKSVIAGKGIFAGEDIKKGQKIFYLSCKIMKRKIKNGKESQRFANWIGVGNDIWLNTNPTKFRYLNHSCEPNAAIVGTKTLIALKDIHKDKEITFDYSMTEGDDEFWKMECKCGSKKCRGTISSIHTVPPEVFKAHFPYIPKYFQRSYLRRYINSQK